MQGRRFGLAIKRLLDLVTSAILLTLSAPLMLVCAAIIKVDSRGSVFFRQERLGLRGQLFRVFKFRTMFTDGANSDPNVSVSDPRITTVGQVFRKFRMDEWPQLINVFRGEMSLIGPRPLVPLHAHAWTEEERKRLNMKPGMSGWQQINGAATNTWEERVALDVWYIEHWSLWLDLKIFLKTPLVVLGAKTVYGRDGHERSAIPTRVLTGKARTDSMSNETASVQRSPRETRL